MSPDDTFVGATPVYTTAGFFQPLTSMLVGNTHITLRWDAEAFIDTIVRRKASTTVIAPTMLLAVVNSLDANPRDVSGFRVMYYGSAPMPFTTLKRAMEHFRCSWVSVYGGTESCGLTTVLRPEDHIGWEKDEHKRRRLEHPSVGTPAVCFRNRVVDEEGREVPKDGKTVGEVEVKGPSTCQRYWKLSEEETREHLRNGCWYLGDIAFWDEDGYIYLVDRKKDMIISGGMNVYSTYVERELYKHPAINEVIVIGVPDEHWGEAVKAVVRLKPGAKATEQEIINWSKECLARYEVPKSVDFVDDFPRSGYKILKREVRDKYWEGRESKI